MPESVVYNCDCLDYMRTLPDNAFEIAIVDPPYGDGLHAESGGGKGWFTKYNMKAPESDYNRHGAEADKTEHRNLRGRFDRYNDAEACSQSVQVERESGPQYNRFGSPGSRFEKYKTPLYVRGSEEGKHLPGTDEGGERSVKKIIAWDVAPGEDYFRELFRVSRNQIIWGGNYFALPPTRCFLIWKKLTISENFTMAMAEYAWTSFNSNAKVFECAPQGKVGDERFHPTQKPIALYKWVLSRYAKPGDRILDTHLGSGSSRIAAWDLGFDFVGCEIDKTYFELEEKRFEEYTRQTRMEL